MSSRKYHHGEVPKAALAAALALVETEGADALTMRGLAQAVGVDHRALYRHYADKDAVLAEVAAQGYRDLLAEQRARIPETDQALNLAFEVYVQFALQRPHLHQLMLTRSRAAMEQSTSLGRAVRAELDQLMDWSRQALGVEAGVRDKDARDLAFAALSSAYGLVTLASTATLMPRGPEDLQAFVTDQVNGILTGQLLRFRNS